MNKKRGCLGSMFQNILFAVNVVFIAIFLISTRAWYHQPSDGLFFSFFGLTYIIWLVANLFFLLCWILLKRWFFTGVQVLVFIFCWSSINVYFPLHFKIFQANIPKEHIKILTYNVDALSSKTKENARKNPIFDYIKSQDADLVCLQEMSLIMQEDNLNDIITYKEVKEILSMYPHVHYQTNYISGKRRSGLMLLSKYPIKEINKINFESTFNGAFIAELDVNGKRVHIIDIHFESNRITSTDKQLYKEFLKNSNKETTTKMQENIRQRMGRGYTIREKQVNMVKEYLSKLDYNYLLICGDFNDTPISYTYYQMTKENDLVDSFRESGAGMGISFREFLFPFRLDYILHSPNMKSYHTWVDDVDYSDHRPVISYFELK